VRLLSRQQLAFRNWLIACHRGAPQPEQRITRWIDALGRNSRLARISLTPCSAPPILPTTIVCRPAVKAYGLEKVVRFLGYVSDQVLQSYVTHADAW